MRRFFVSTFSLLATVCPATAVQTAAVGCAGGACPSADEVGKYMLTSQEGLLSHAVSGRPFPPFRLNRREGVRAIPAPTYDPPVVSRISANGRLLAPEAAYLYYSFIQGAHAMRHDYGLGLGRKKSSLPLQAAIVMVQGKGGGLLDSPDAGAVWESFHGSSAHYAWACAVVDEPEGPTWTPAKDIRVLNLSALAQTTAGEGGQDMLTLLVPVPGAFGMGAAGLAMLGWFRRRSAL